MVTFVTIMSHGAAGDPSADLNSTDVRVLAYLAESGADYPALVASNTGLHAPHVERRCDALRDAGLVESVSGEVVYRITGDGRDVLSGGGGCASD